MRVSNYRDTTVFRLGVRGGASQPDDDRPEDEKPGVQYRRLFRGDPKQPGNFEMCVLRSPKDDADIHFPHHRHNFDQVRLTLAGNPAWAPRRAVPPGSIVYTAAGTFYGPYDRFGGEEQLHIQFEGANHAPFLDYDTVAEARIEMSQRGTFTKGFYTITDAGGRERKVDAHQAVMEFITGQPLEYPPSRYKDSIQIDPAVFAWQPEAPGVDVRHLGVFTEALTALRIIRVGDQAELVLSLSDQTRLLFVTEGAGRALDSALAAWDGVLVEPGETGLIRGERGLQLFELTLPLTAGDATEGAASDRI